MKIKTDRVSLSLTAILVYTGLPWVLSVLFIPNATVKIRDDLYRMCTIELLVFAVAVIVGIKLFQMLNNEPKRALRFLSDFKILLAFFKISVVFNYCCIFCAQFNYFHFVYQMFMITLVYFMGFWVLCYLLKIELLDWEASTLAQHDLQEGNINETQN